MHDPTTKAALIVAATYEGSAFPILRWAAADAAALARTLVRHCGFEQVIVLHRRPHPLLTEGELGDVRPVLERLRDQPKGPAAAVRRELWPEPRSDRDQDELQELAAIVPALATPEQRDSLEALVVSVFNRWIGGGTEPTQAALDSDSARERRTRLLEAFPELAPPTSPDAVVRDGPIEYRGRATEASVRSAMVGIDMDPTGQHPRTLLFTALCGHGIQLRGRNCFVLPDSNNRFLPLTTLPVEHLVRWVGSQALFIDACQVVVHPGRAPGDRHDGRGFAPSANRIDRDLAGLAGTPEMVNWSLSAPPTPAEGTVALLHTCWPGATAAELHAWRQGLGTRCLLEALRAGAWRTADPASSTGSPERELTFDEVARQVHRGVQAASRRLAREAYDSDILQAPFLHRAGVAEPLVLARTPMAAATAGPAEPDPRLWIHPPRFADIHDAHPFVADIPFVHVDQGRVLMACWTTRNRDLHGFIAAGGWDGPVPPLDPDLPCTRVPCFVALRFCAWLTRHHIERGILPPVGFRYDLPTGSEWDIAAGLLTELLVCPRDRVHPPLRPWRGETRPDGCHFAGSTPIAAHRAAPSDHSTPYVQPIRGIRGLAGNVWEMIPEPFDEAARSVELDGIELPERITLRGQSFLTPVEDADLWQAEAMSPKDARADVGFRLVLRRIG